MACVHLGRCRLGPGDFQPNLDVVTQEPQTFGAMRGRKQARAQSGSSDRIRFVQQSVAPRVETRQRHGESKTDHQRQQTEHRGFQGGHIGLPRDAQTKMMADLARNQDSEHAHRENRRERVNR